ncbi:hypothetical protein ES5_08596 [Dietzia cinnamea P4]|nr:hypothetical protein ES5_08596 [Dietzia cinnamea P4]
MSTSRLRGSRVSTAAARACRSTRWHSWITAVLQEATRIDSSHSSSSGLGPPPVRAHVVTPRSRARRAAAMTFSLVPLVDSSTRMSPGEACASTWRAKTSA